MAIRTDEAGDLDAPNSRDALLIHGSTDKGVGGGVVLRLSKDSYFYT